MNDDFKTSVEKLVADGCHESSWITYRDRVLLGDGFPYQNTFRRQLLPTLDVGNIVYLTS
jgi:hypothetical protein